MKNTLLKNSLGKEKHHSTDVINITLNISPKTKKNSQRLIVVNGRPRIIPSKLYEQYEKDCAWFLPHLDKPIDYPINLKCIFYMPTRRCVDLCNLQEAVCDMLVHYGILADDNRNIVATMDGSMVLYDKKNPHTDIEISKKLDYNKW